MVDEKDDNVDPRLKPTHVRNPEMAPRGLMGTAPINLPLVEIPKEQKEEISREYRQRQFEKERSKIREELKLGVRGEGKSPYLAKREFDRNKGLDR